MVTLCCRNGYGVPGRSLSAVRGQNSYSWLALSVFPASATGASHASPAESPKAGEIAPDRHGSANAAGWAGGVGCRDANLASGLAGLQGLAGFAGPAAKGGGERGLP